MNTNDKNNEQPGNTGPGDSGIDCSYECVEPELGRELYQYGLPETRRQLQSQLELHLTICEACRFELAVKQHVARGLRDGSYTLGADNWLSGWLRQLHLLPGPDSWVGATGTAAGVVLAASLLLVFLLPPTAPELDTVSRSAVSGPFLNRPVEGEVVMDRHPQLSWDRIEGASGYKITLDDVGGGYEWMGQTRENNISPDKPVPLNSRLRAFLEPIPADLAPQGGHSVSFHCGTLVDFLCYRVAASPQWIRYLGSMGLLFLLTAIAIRSKR